MVELSTSVFKLHKAADDSLSGTLTKLLLPDEVIVGVFKTVRDSVVFTDRRIMITDVKGAGKKQDVTTVPYRMLNKFSVQTSGILDADSELEIHLICGETLKFEFLGGKHIFEVGQALAKYAL